MTHGIGLGALVPGAVFEFVLPIWLIVKGFRALLELSEAAASPSVVIAHSRSSAGSSAQNQAPQ